MSSTSKKHRNFVSEPIRGKSSTSLAGVGETYGNRLANRGYGSARSVVGKYLQLDKDERLFREWMSSATGANAKQTKDCYNCVNEWSNNFL